MFRKLFMLFKIGRKLSTSGAISSIYEIYDPPITIKILFFVIGFSFNDKKNNNNLSPGVKLCNALQGMGTTFIKLGQFLATRPDIIGENLSSANHQTVCCRHDSGKYTGTNQSCGPGRQGGNEQLWYCLVRIGAIK